MAKKKMSEEIAKIRFEIALMTENYLKSKRIICEYEENIIDLSSNRLEIHNRIVHHIEYVVEMMYDKEKIIIENEVLRGRRGKWYKGIMSSPSYYRYRDIAYRNFLDCL